MLQVKICNVHQMLYEGSAGSVELPTVTGELTVLPFHAPLVCALSPGHVFVGEDRVAIESGLARVQDNAVWVWVEEPCRG